MAGPANSLNITQQGTVYFNGVSVFTGIDGSTPGKVLTSNGPGVAPSFQTNSAASAVLTITGNSGGAQSPLAGNFNILGTGSITLVGTANTETVQLTGLTNHAVLVGAGTATITKIAATANTGAVLQNNSGADPSYSTATYPSTATSTGTILRANGTNWVATTATYPTTTTANQILYSSATNVIGGITTANSGVLTTNGSGVPSISTSLSIAGSITAGTTITATAGNITATSGNFVLTAATTAAVGQITQSGLRVFHTFGGTTNLFLGSEAGNFTLSGTANNMTGQLSGASLTTGSQNAGYGLQSLNALQGGSDNTAYGYFSLGSLVSGSQNTIIGRNAGQAYTTTESNNICIGYLVQGTIGDSNVIRIGNASNTTCFITGISGVTVTGTAVLCSAAGQLGTIASSIRYKENIINMPNDISVMNLRPVQFNYKADANKTIQYGLIAEEVDKDFPYLCFYKDKKPESVKYHELCVFLLAEVQRLSERVKKLELQGKL